MLLSNQAPPKGGVLRQVDEIEALFTLRLELELFWIWFLDGISKRKEVSTGKSFISFLEDFCFLTKVAFPSKGSPESFLLPLVWIYLSY